MRVERHVYDHRAECRSICGDCQIGSCQASQAERLGAFRGISLKERGHIPSMPGDMDDTNAFGLG